MIKALGYIAQHFEGFVSRRLYDDARAAIVGGLS